MGKGERARQARQKLEQVRAQQRAQARRRKAIAWAVGGVGAAVVVAVIAIVVFSGGGSSSGHEVMPAPVGGGTPVVQPAAVTIPNTTGIKGVVAYDTTGWPTSSSNGPAKQALGHSHVPGPVRYSVIPPVGGDHNATWMNCGVYDKPVPDERAVHNLEHGAVWITYQPSLPKSEVNQLRAFFTRQSFISPGGAARSRYLDLTPYPRAPGPDRRLLVGIPAAPHLTRRPAAAAIRQHVPGDQEIHARIRSPVHRRYRHPAAELMPDRRQMARTVRPGSFRRTRHRLDEYADHQIIKGPRDTARHRASSAITCRRSQRRLAAREP